MTLFLFVLVSVVILLSVTAVIIDETRHQEQQQPVCAISRPVTVNIQGYGKAVGRREGGIDVWRGIPYAAPPIGSLRFAPPEPPQPWSPTKLDASRYAPDCWQSRDPTINPLPNLMSEDCLYLNIWSPAGHNTARSRLKLLTPMKLLPVMVWLHGGAFQQGGAHRPEYDGRRLAEREVIVVTINYRLGALGFLVSSSDGLYGNYGLMDQRAAIYWVHENIEAFGGDPNSVTLFGESAGAVMAGLHLMMEGAGTLFQRAILQSNPLGYTFRPVVVADFIGEALKQKIECRDLACLRSEKVEEIMTAQISLMGVPRSVGDFFTWGPTLTKENKVQVRLRRDGVISRSEEHRLPRLDSAYPYQFVSEWRREHDAVNKSGSAKWRAVNVSQPLNNLDLIPDNIPIIIGTNKHEGEIFVHSAFPIAMAKPVYWMFVGALFRDSSWKILQHYRGLVDEVEREAEELARKQIEEQEARQEYLENREQLEREYEQLLAMNATRKRTRLQRTRLYNSGPHNLSDVVNTWARGGFIKRTSPDHEPSSITQNNTTKNLRVSRLMQRLVTATNLTSSNKLMAKMQGRIRAMQSARKEYALNRARKRAARREQNLKESALKNAAKVVVDYRPVMSRIIDDYLFRCPSWHFAQVISERREQRGVIDNVFVYRFSQPTHIPGYKECWGKSCHTSELPFVFQAMEILRTNYSTLSPFAQQDAPSAPEYPYKEFLAACRGAIEAAGVDDAVDQDNNSSSNILHSDAATNNNHAFHHSKAFQKILNHFFGDYFAVDADEELAHDMAERWASFSRTSNPNYEGSPKEWLPWWNLPNSSMSLRRNSQTDEDSNYQSTFTDFENFWDDFEDQHPAYDETNAYGEDDFGDEYEDQNSNLLREQYYRQKALTALDLEVAEEDVFRIELRRSSRRSGNALLNGGRERIGGLLSQYLSSSTSGRKPVLDSMHHQQQVPRYDPEQVLSMAQEYGVMGRGLLGNGNERSEFLPEFLDLSWPPEERLIERDCTCDLWDRLRYRY